MLSPKVATFLSDFVDAQSDSDWHEVLGRYRADLVGGHLITELIELLKQLSQHEMDSDQRKELLRVFSVLGLALWTEAQADHDLQAGSLRFAKSLRLLAPEDVMEIQGNSVIGELATIPDGEREEVIQRCRPILLNPNFSDWLRSYVLDLAELDETSDERKMETALYLRFTAQLCLEGPRDRDIEPVVQIALDGARLLAPTELAELLTIRFFTEFAASIGSNERVVLDKFLADVGETEAAPRIQELARQTQASELTDEQRQATTVFWWKLAWHLRELASDRPSLTPTAEEASRVAGNLNARTSSIPDYAEVVSQLAFVPEGQERQFINRNRHVLTQPGFPPWLTHIAEEFAGQPAEAIPPKQWFVITFALFKALLEPTREDPSLFPSLMASSYCCSLLAPQDSPSNRYDPVLIAFQVAPDEHGEDQLLLVHSRFFVESGWQGWVPRQLSKEEHLPLAAQLLDALERVQLQRPEVFEDVVLTIHFSILTASDRPGNEKFLAFLEQHIGQLYLMKRTGEHWRNVEEAIPHLELAAARWNTLGEQTEWALAQANLGGAYALRAKGQELKNIEQALTHYREASRIITPDVDLKEWTFLQLGIAMLLRRLEQDETWHNIEDTIDLIGHHYNAVRELGLSAREFVTFHIQTGDLYLSRALGDVGENVRTAINWYMQALPKLDRRSNPYDWARLHRCLGTAYHQLLLGDRRQNIEKAIKHLQQALTVYQKGSTPTEWAIVHIGLAHASLKRLSGDKWRNVEEAIGHLQQAGKVLTKDDSAPAWANLQEMLGIAYSERVVEEEGWNLRQSISYFWNTTLIWHADSHPFSWARTQTNLGNAYQRLQDDRRDNVRRSIDRYQDALTKWKLRSSPREWGMVQFNLGRAHSELGERDIAISSFQNACIACAVAGELEDLGKAALLWGNELLGTTPATRLEEAEMAFLLAVEAAQSVRLQSIHPHEQHRLLEILASAALGAGHCAAKLSELPLACALFDLAKGAELRDLLVRDPSVVLSELPADRQPEAQKAFQLFESARLRVESWKEHRDAVSARLPAVPVDRTTFDMYQAQLATAEKGLHEAEAALLDASAEVEELLNLETFRDVRSGFLGIDLREVLVALQARLRNGLNRGLSEGELTSILVDHLAAVAAHDQAKSWLTTITIALNLPPTPRTALHFGVTQWGTHVFTIDASEGSTDIRLRHHYIPLTDEQLNQGLDSEILVTPRPSASKSRRSLRPAKRWSGPPTGLARWLNSQGFPSLQSLLGDARRVVIVPHRSLHRIPWSLLPVDPAAADGRFMYELRASTLPALFLAPWLAGRAQTDVDDRDFRAFVCEGAEQNPQLEDEPKPVLLGRIWTERVRETWVPLVAAMRELTVDSMASDSLSDLALNYTGESEIVSWFGHGHLDDLEPLNGGFRLPDRSVLTVESLYRRVKDARGLVAVIVACNLGRPGDFGMTSDPRASLPWALLIGGIRQVIAGYHPVVPLPAVILSLSVHDELRRQIEENEQVDAAEALAKSFERIRTITAGDLRTTLRGWSASYRRVNPERDPQIPPTPLDERILNRSTGDFISDVEQIAGWLEELDLLSESDLPFAKSWTYEVPLTVYGL